MATTEVTINQQKAQTIYISHPTASYGIFCFNSIGDLFVNSDWGSYGFAWRSYGTNFTSFLSSLNPEYVVDKFEINFQQTNRKPIPKTWKANLTILVQAFIEAVKSNSNELA